MNKSARMSTGFTSPDTSVMTNGSAGGSDREAYEGAGQVLQHSSAAGEISVGSLSGPSADIKNNRQFHTGGNQILGSRGMMFEMNAASGVWTIVALMILYFVLTRK